MQCHNCYTLSLGIWFWLFWMKLIQTPDIKELMQYVVQINFVQKYIFSLFFTMLMLCSRGSKLLKHKPQAAHSRQEMENTCTIKHDVNFFIFQVNVLKWHFFCSFSHCYVDNQIQFQTHQNIMSQSFNLKVLRWALLRLGQ